VEKLAPGWYKVRSYTWLTRQLVMGKMDRHVIESLKSIEDGAFDDTFKANLASSMSTRYPEIPMFYLLEGISLSRMNQKMRAEQVFVCVVILGLISSSFGHICTLFPPQRVPLYGLNTVASNSCFNIEAPCGNNTPTTPMVELIAGSTYNITFQKNQNHWTTPAGNFTISISLSAKPNTKWEMLAVIPDTNTPALTLYDLPITLPSQASPHAVLRVHYDCLGLPFTFFACSDIKLVPFFPAKHT